MNDPIVEIHETNMRTLARLATVFRAASGTRSLEGASPHKGEGSGLEFREFSPYKAGDDRRRIDWRTTLRRDRTYIRTFESESAANWTICLDASASMSKPDRRRWILANQVAAALAWILLDGGHRVGLVAFSSGITAYCPNAAGRRQYLRMAGTLSRLVAADTTGVARPGVVATRLPSSAHIVMISDFLGEDAMTGDLSRLGRRGRHLHAVRIASADDVPSLDTEPVDIVDVETGERLTPAPGANELARARFDRLDRLLRECCDRMHVHLSTCRSNTDWQAAIMNHARGRRG